MADAYDRAARMVYGKIPPRTAEGDRLRSAARLLVMAGGLGDASTREAIQLTASLVRLARAVGELRQAEQHAAQAAAARKVGSASTRASPRRGQTPQCQADHISYSSPALLGGHQISPAEPSRSRDGSASGHRRPATASPSRGHKTSPGPVRRPPSRAGPCR